MNSRLWRFLSSGVGYVLCVLACKYVVQLAASELAKFIYWLPFPFARAQLSDLLGFYTRNWLFFNVIAGIAFGLAIYSVWQNHIATIVWIPPFCVLCEKILKRPHSILSTASVGSDISYFLSPGCPEVSTINISQRCTDQLVYSLPFYAALGFSMGSLMCIIWRQHRSRSHGSSPLSESSSSEPSETVDDHHQSPENRRSSEE